MDDDYEAAIESPAATTADPADAGTPAAPDTAAPAKADTTADEAVDDPSAGPRYQRVRSAASRAMFKAIVAQGGVGEADELEPAIPNKASPDAAPAAPAHQPTAAALKPASPPAASSPVTPVAPPPGLPALPSMPLAAIPTTATIAPPDPKHAEREAALAAREAAVVEREKLLPDRQALAERPAETVINWVLDGITDPAERKMALTDLVTELSERGLEVTLPPELKTAIESRKGLRSLKAYKATLDQREAKLKEQTEAQTKAQQAAAAAAAQEQQVTAYIANIDQLIAPAKEQHRFLHDLKVTGGAPAAAIVYAVLEEQQRLGQKPDLATATEYANNFYKSRAESAAKEAAYFASLFAPPAPAAPAAAAKLATSPGGAPGPAPTKPAVPAPATPVLDPSDLPVTDRQERRHASRRAIAARIRTANAAAEAAARGTP